MRSRSVYGVLPLDERSCRSARGRSAKVRKITDSTNISSVIIDDASKYRYKEV